MFKMLNEGPPKNYFHKEVALLKIVGVSLSGNESGLYKIYAFIFNFFIFTYPIAQFGDLFKHDFDEAASIASYQFGVVLSIAKTTVILLNRRNFGKLLAKLEEPPFAPNTERGGDKIEEQLVKNCLWLTTAQTLTYWSCSVASVLFDASNCIMRRLRSDDYHNWRFTYGKLTVLNVTHSPNYEISWFYQTFCVSSVASHFTTIDLVTAGVLAHISCQFQMLQNNIKRMVTNSHRDMLKETISEDDSTPNQHEQVNVAKVSWKYLYKSLKETVEYHLAIMDITKEMENLYENLLLLVFLGTVGMLCFMVYCASLLEINDVKMMAIAVQTFTMCIQILLICYWGEMVMYESQQVGNVVFETDFVGTDLRFQKGLILIMARSNIPVKLTAGKFTDICLSTFTWILRSSYSVFMVLRNNNQRKRM